MTTTKITYWHLYTLFDIQITVYKLVVTNQAQYTTQLNWIEWAICELQIKGTIKYYNLWEWSSLIKHFC